MYWAILTLIFVLAVDTTHGAGCPPGWRWKSREICVVAVKTRMTWLSAKQWCLSLHPHATIASNRPGQYWSHVDEFRGQPHWIGISDKSSEAVWQYEEGGVAEALPWAYGEPSDGVTKPSWKVEDCGRMQTGALFDEPCHSRKVLLPFACSLEVKYNMRPNRNECLESWTKGNNACYYVIPGEKQKSWPAAQEACHKVDHSAGPLKKGNAIDGAVAPNTEAKPKKLFWLDPTNQGHFCKLLHYKQGTAKYVYASCDAKHGAHAHTLCERAFCRRKCCAGATFYNGRCNLVVRQSMTRPQAEQHCRAVHPGAHLATIRNDDENDFLVYLAMPDGVPYPYKPDLADSWYNFWVGLKRSSCSCRWHWEDATAVTCLKWWRKHDQSRWTTLEIYHGKWVGWNTTEAAEHPFICQWREC